MQYTASSTLSWSARHQAYELTAAQLREILRLTSEDPTWFAWLEDVSSFAFQGQRGSYTARKEPKRRGALYWYAYRKREGKLTKKYLGKTADLTFARLEDVAGLLYADPPTVPPTTDSAPSPPAPHEMVLPHGHADGSRVDPPPILAPHAPPNTHDDQLPPRLSTKLHVPRPRTQLVARPALIERLQEGVQGPLTLVSAPAGFGKTTLLAQWLAQSGAPAAWLSLEPEDNDPVRFLTYLIAALQTVDAHLGATALALLHTPQPPPPGTVMALLTNDLMRYAAEECVLVLDDCHVLTAEPVHRALSYLVEHQPPQLHLILVTRADLPLPLARLRACGQLTEVRAAELRFRTAEVREFLQVVMELDLSVEAMLALESRTEGWIAGLQLAALSLRGRTDVASFLAAFSGSHRFVLDYLTEEVFSRQPASVQSFLLHTCTLERLCAPLCDAVTGREGSQAIVEALERANLFVVALDDERQWYRYHHLFADVLRSRLQQTQPTLVSELHRRASTWYEEHDLPAEAIQHALAAPDFEHAAHLIERVCISYALRGHLSTVLGWLNRLPDALVRMRPFLCLSHADMLMFTNQVEEAEARLRDAEGCVQAGTSAEQAQMILGRVAVIRGHHCRYIGDLTRCVTLAQEALDLLSETEKVARASAVVNAAHAFLLSGDVTPVTRRQVRASTASVRAVGNPFQILTSMTLLARLRVLQGRLREAAATYEEVEQVALEQKALRILTNGAAYYFGLGDLLRERDELDEAFRCLADGMDTYLSVFEEGYEVTLGYIALARLQQARGEYSQALATLDAFADLASLRHYVPQLLAQGAAVQAHVELAQGNLGAAIRWADGSGLSPDDSEFPYPREREYLTLARVRIAQGRFDPAGPFLQEAMRLLDRLLQDAQSKARMGSALEILLLQALALEVQQEQSGALVILERALLLAEPEGYIRLFVDEGTPMLTLLREIQARGIAPNYVAILLAAFGESVEAAAARSATQRSSLIEPLTPREREVLQLLSEGASNREIARHLVLSTGTVKKYVYNICGKLGVQSRTQAIARARMLQLL